MLSTRTLLSVERGTRLNGSLHLLPSPSSLAREQGRGAGGEGLRYGQKNRLHEFPVTCPALSCPKKKSDYR